LRVSKNQRGSSALFIVLLVIGIVVIIIGAVFLFLWVLPGNQRTENLDFRDFSAIEAGSAVQVSVIQSDSYGVKISAGEKVFDRIEVTQEGQTLKIGVKPGLFFGIFDVKVEITMPALNSLELSGACRGVIDGFSSSSQFIAKVSGASSLDLSNFMVGDVEFEVSGASHVTGEGTGNNLATSVSGASNLDLTNFQVNDANVNLSEASHAIVNLTGRLDANVSGGSNLEYIGEPTLGNITTSGGSNINKK
jgi:hypothetical protein